MLDITTPRLRIEAVTDSHDREALLAVFNSNPQYIANEEQDPERRSYSIEDVERYLDEETTRPGSRCLVIRDGRSGRLIGTACLLVPHPVEGIPWIGLLLIHGDGQGRGVGAESAAAIEQALAIEGWETVRIGVLFANPRARKFWTRQGYELSEETTDTNGRPCWILQKHLCVRKPEAGSAQEGTKRNG